MPRVIEYLHEKVDRLIAERGQTHAVYLCDLRAWLAEAERLPQPGAEDEVKALKEKLRDTQKRFAEHVRTSNVKYGRAQDAMIALVDQHEDEHGLALDLPALAAIAGAKLAAAEARVAELEKAVASYRKDWRIHNNAICENLDRIATLTEKLAAAEARVRELERYEAAWETLRQRVQRCFTLSRNNTADECFGHVLDEIKKLYIDAPREERPEKPALLLNGRGRFSQWWTASQYSDGGLRRNAEGKQLWESRGETTTSDCLLSVDREASDARALELFDADLQRKGGETCSQ